MIRLLIADDHAIMRSGLRQIFALMPEVAVAAEAHDGQKVLEILQHQTFDLLLLDVSMPGLSGAELIAQVQQQHAELPILVLSMHDKPHIAKQMLAAGANGFITKDCEPEILLAAIRKVAAGGNYIDPAIAEKMAFHRGIHPAGAATSPAPASRPRHHLLSPREREVLQWLTQGFAIKQIGEQLAISNKTVSTHKLRLMQKLEVANMPELMRYAIENGLDAAPAVLGGLPLAAPVKF